MRVKQAVYSLSLFINVELFSVGDLVATIPGRIFIDHIFRLIAEQSVSVCVYFIEWLWTELSIENA